MKIGIYIIAKNKIIFSLNFPLSKVKAPIENIKKIPDRDKVSMIVVEIIHAIMIDVLLLKMRFSIFL
ncbi:hypothetical protein DSCOOX_08360 [Desulfosarcina ovata subsp. ovata]|uniref:Uncharacterized protein n=1 Tax=Desulfosarcina ovata subsp. ovata TaxID=2752305 RepID=A0A5K8A5D2_9BACT|nr:hypothetical protein DSCOOX_08360 [Desulfosarcina ovata subsp. ovata]